jgi:hypothetical protein
MARIPIRRSIAMTVVACGLAAGAVAVAQAPDDSSANRRPIEASCEAYARSDQGSASADCVGALQSGELTGVNYGPGSGSP